MNVSEKVCLLMSDEGCGVFPLSEVHVERLIYDLGFDSLRYMELVVLLEETFRIAFPDEMLEISSQTTVSEIVLAVEACLKNERE